MTAALLAAFGCIFILIHIGMKIGKTLSKLKIKEQPQQPYDVVPMVPPRGFVGRERDVELDIEVKQSNRKLESFKSKKVTKNIDLECYQ